MRSPSSSTRRLWISRRCGILVVLLAATGMGADPPGHLLWVVTLDGPPYWLQVGQLDGDAGLEVAASNGPRQDCWSGVVLLDSDGTRLCETQTFATRGHVVRCIPRDATGVCDVSFATSLCSSDVYRIQIGSKGECRTSRLGSLATWVDGLVGADLHPGGGWEVVAGTWGDARAFDLEGNELWQYGGTSHSSGPISAGDLDGDGADDVVMSTADLDGRVHALGADGGMLWLFSPDAAGKGIAAIILDADGEGRNEVLAWQDDGTAYLLSGSSGRVLWGPIELGAPLGLLEQDLLARITPGRLYFDARASQELRCVEMSTGSILARKPWTQAAGWWISAVGRFLSGDRMAVAVPDLEAGVVRVHDDLLRELSVVPLPFEADEIFSLPGDLDGDGIDEIVLRGGNSVAALKIQIPVPSLELAEVAPGRISVLANTDGPTLAFSAGFRIEGGAADMGFRHPFPGAGWLALREGGPECFVFAIEEGGRALKLGVVPTLSPPLEGIPAGWRIELAQLVVCGGIIPGEEGTVLFAEDVTSRGSPIALVTQEGASVRRSQGI